MKARSKKPSQYTVQDYYAERIMVGGQVTTRGAFIKEMGEAGHDQRRIDMYLMGQERGTAARQKRAIKDVEL